MASTPEEAPMTTGEPAATTPQQPRRRTGRLVGGIIALVIGVLGFALGGTLVGLHLGARDDDGFYEIDTNDLRTPTRALVTDSVKIDVSGAWIIDESDLGDVKIEATAARAAPVFVGIGPTAAVRTYLAGVPQQQADLTDGSLGARTPGVRVPAPPAAQRFWVASAQGGGQQAVTWAVRDGEWSAVIMNADAARGVDVSARLAFRSDLVLWVGIPALVIGALLTALGVWLVMSSRPRPTGPAPAAPAAPPPPPA
jgi:hypothetical protein